MSNPQTQESVLNDVLLKNMRGIRVDVGSGYLELVDWLGTDQSLAQAARVSVKTATRRSTDEGLLRTLIREKHTSPIEFGDLIVCAVVPIFVARQWVRHRMSSVSEQSGRYSQMDELFHVFDPAEWTAQGETNRQMSGGLLPVEIGEELTKEQIEQYDRAYASYQSLLANGVAREKARAVLPLGIYTRWYWKIDIHNLMHFLQLRLAPDAQLEFQPYARALAGILQELFPMTWKAFADYRLNARTFSRMEVEILQKNLGIFGEGGREKQLLMQMQAKEVLSPREAGDFIKKLVNPFMEVPTLEEQGAKPNWSSLLR